MGAELAAQSAVSARSRREAAAEAAHLNAIADASLDWVRSFTYNLSKAGSILSGYYSSMQHSANVGIALSVALYPLLW